MNLSQLNQLPPELQAIATVKDFAAGHVLFTQHEPAAAIFVLVSGQIQLVNYIEDGQQVHHYSVKAGESFAEMALFNEVYGCTAIARASSQVLVLPKQPFLIALRQHPDLAETFMARLAYRLHESKILLELRSIRSAQKRVMHYLQLNVQPDDITVTIDRPLKEVADDLGLTPEALSRALTKLHQEEKINRGKRKVTLRKEFPEIDPNHGSSQVNPLKSRTN